MELQINPMLYEGVRERGSGKLGKHWHPAPAELPKIDHVRFPHAIALGLVLPIRWRWVWAERGQDHLTLEASKLLNLAGIPWTRGRPRRAWDALDRTLEELQRIGELGRVEWCGEKHSLATMVRLYPADWILDRTVRGLTPVERKPIIAPVNGAELVEWRREKGWSQAVLAKEIGVGIATVKRAERAAKEPLGRALLEAFKSYPQRTLEKDAKTS
jgi:DNA-binding transcriptional regulator YiaG